MGRIEGDFLASALSIVLSSFNNLVLFMKHSSIHSLSFWWSFKCPQHLELHDCSSSLTPAIGNSQHCFSDIRSAGQGSQLSSQVTAITKIKKHKSSDFNLIALSCDCLALNFIWCAFQRKKNPHVAATCCSGSNTFVNNSAFYVVNFDNHMSTIWCYKILWFPILLILQKSTKFQILLTIMLMSFIIKS